MTPISLCRSCGEAFSQDEMVDDICMQCSEYFDDGDRVPLDFDEIYDKIDKAGDCV